MQKFNYRSQIKDVGVKPLFPVTSNPDLSGLLCSPEHGKLCFEHPEKISDAQNNLPYAGGRKTSEVGFYIGFKRYLLCNRIKGSN